LVGHPINKKKVEQDHKVIALSKIMKLKALPGVERLMITARDNGIKMALASNSSTDWVWCNLSRLGLAKYFDTICGGDEVAALKPDPEIFQLALSELNVSPDEAIVFEDSPNGITAANKAGIFCVAIPNPISERLSIVHANLVLNSLEEISFEELLAAPERQIER
ncbi:MAG TPA: HAD-IA family hydrolase, partial [Leptolinea sp.]